MTAISSQMPLLTRTEPEHTSGEQQAISRAQAGDLDAFNEIVLAYQEHVFRQAYWMLGDEAAAEDAAQEAFLLAFTKLHTFRGGPFRPWLLRIATNHCIDQIRRNNRRPQVTLDQFNEYGEEYEPNWIVDTGELPERTVERAETGREIARAMRRLTAEYRAAVILIDLQELDYAEAAAVLHIPIGTLKSRLARARRQLQAFLSGHRFPACAFLR